MKTKVSLINYIFLFLNTKNFTELERYITLKSIPVRTFEIAKNILIYDLIFVVAEVVVLGPFFKYFSVLYFQSR